MHRFAGNWRLSGGLVLTAFLVGCTTTPGAAPGGEFASAPPLPAVDTPGADESDASELVWDEYPSDAGKFLELTLPVLSVSLDLPFLNDQSCAEMPVWVALEEFGTSLPPSLSNETILANFGFLPWAGHVGLAEAAVQESIALRRHCDEVVSAEARYRSVVDAIPAYASEDVVRQTINSAVEGRSALVSRSFQDYLDERSYLDNSLQFIVCYFRRAFPEDGLLLMENLQVSWRAEVLRAHQLSNFIRLESTGRPFSIPASDLTELWIESEWGDEGSFEAWLCGVPQ